MLLLDTNIWLERLLNQTHAPEVERLLDTFAATDLAISDFSLHSIGVILGRAWLEYACCVSREMNDTVTQIVKEALRAARGMA